MLGGDFTGAWIQGNLSGSGSVGFERLQEGEGDYRWQLNRESSDRLQRESN